MDAVKRRKIGLLTVRICTAVIDHVLEDVVRDEENVLQTVMSCHPSSITKEGIT